MAGLLFELESELNYLKTDVERNMRDIFVFEWSCFMCQMKAIP